MTCSPVHSSIWVSFIMLLCFFESCLGFWQLTSHQVSRNICKVCLFLSMIPLCFSTLYFLTLRESKLFCCCDFYLISRLVSWRFDLKIANLSNVWLYKENFIIIKICTVPSALCSRADYTTYPRWLAWTRAHEYALVQIQNGDSCCLGDQLADRNRIFPACRVSNSDGAPRAAAAG